MDAEWAWAAGFYEGEGSISTSGRHLHMSLSQVNLEPLERYLRIVDRGKIYGPYKGNRKNPIYTWQVQGQGAVDVFLGMADQLSERRLTQGAVAIEAWNNRPRKKVQTKDERRAYQAEWTRKRSKDGR